MKFVLLMALVPWISRQPGIKRRKKLEREKSQRDQMIQKDLEKVLRQSHTWEDFLERLEDMGYALRGKKHLAVLEPGAAFERYRRIDTISEEYTEENIRKRLSVHEEEKIKCSFYTFHIKTVI